MRTADGQDGQARPQAGVDTSVDRRRPGRPQNVNSALIPMLRGTFDADAPPDPAIELPYAVRWDWELVYGLAIAIALISVGSLLRFIP